MSTTEGLKVGDKFNEAKSGANLQVGVLNLGGETISKTETVVTSISGTSLTTNIDKTTETTTWNTSLGIKGTPLSAGFQAAITSYSQFGKPIGGFLKVNSAATRMPDLTLLLLSVSRFQEPMVLK